MQLPDGPKLHPIVQSINWIRKPLQYLEECAEKYGNIFTIKLSGVKPLVIISDPEAIKQIFTFQSENINVSSKNNLLLPIIGENSLLLLNGSRHKRERKIIMPSFHGEKVKSYAETICKITEKVASQWEIDRSFPAIAATQTITLEVIIQTVFGFRTGKRYEEIKPLLENWAKILSSPAGASFLFFKFLQIDLGAWSPWGNFIRNRQQINDLLQAEIEDRRAHPEQQGNDILSLMLSARDEAGQPMNDEQLKGELLTLLLAGHRTTAISLAWAFYWINHKIEIKEKLLQEIDSLGENPDPIAISRLPYLTAFCQEVLRIYPVFPTALARMPKSRFTLMGRQFEAGTVLMPCIYLTHHREDLYPNSKEFRPERFLERQYTNYEFIPFGGGVRLCVGYALAMLEMKLVVATILSKYELALVDNELPKPKRTGLSLAPSNGIPLVMKGLRESKKILTLN
ncbi:MAG: cytochrome P450 [Prochloraceae cyanobacterium]|nr:cytochrome P450 [Prochloraceae cyanobacterium]